MLLQHPSLPVQAGRAQQAGGSRPALRRAPVATIVTAGLRKETKRLTKALKTHRTRLESLMSVVQQQQDAGVAAAAATPHHQRQRQRLSPAQLHAVLAEIAQLQTSLAAVQQQQRQLAAMQIEARPGACDSSDSDSDCEDAAAPPRRRQQRAADLQQQEQQQQQMTGARSSSRQPVVAAAALLTTTCPQPPAVDCEDITLQLPPPQAYAEAGRVLVCQGKACMRRGALQVLQAASHAAAASPGLEVLPCKCLGKCKAAPAVRVRSEAQPRSAVFTEVAPLEVPDILDHVLGSSSC